MEPGYYWVTYKEKERICVRWHGHYWIHGEKVCHHDDITNVSARVELDDPVCPELCNCTYNTDGTVTIRCTN